MTNSFRHIAIVAPPTAGHLNPLVALGEALVARGHRVTLVHMADVAALMPVSSVRFAPLAEAADRPGRLRDHYRNLAQPSGPIGLPRMIRSTAAITRLLLDALPATLRGLGIDAVIADSVEPAGGLVARHLGLPFVTAVTGLPLLHEPNVPPPFLGWRYRPDAVGRIRNAGGYAISERLMMPINRPVAARARLWNLDPAFPNGSSHLHIAQCPQGLDFPRRELPADFRYGAPWRLAEPTDALPPDDGRPLVFCSLGSLQGARKSLFAAMTQACAAVGARAVVAHGGGLTDAEAARLPGAPIVRAFWSQTTLLPRCAAAVLHCGFNSVLDALAAGLPIVAVPIAFEQPATAARLAHVGAGRIVTLAGTRTGALQAALHAVLTTRDYRQAALRIGREIAAQGGVAAAADAVDEALTTTG